VVGYSVSNFAGSASREGLHAGQESGSPQKAEHREAMGYNDSGHKETPDGQWGW